MPDKATWVNAEPHRDACQTIIVPGPGAQVLTRGRVGALYHQVVAEDVSQHRYSAVAFMDMLSVCTHKKKEFGSMQGYPIGFNYGMPDHEFRRHFEISEKADALLVQELEAT